jgi:hypothetical protein
MKTDPKEYALKALEVAKQDLRRDQYLLPVAFILTDTEIIDFNLKFSGADQKASVYTKLVEIAKQKSGRAIITVNDGIKTDPTSAEKQDCIYVAVSGPQIPTWSVTLPYMKVGDEIYFGDPTESLNDFLSLLPGWAAKQPIVS